MKSHVVIFRARHAAAASDPAYLETALTLRDKALAEYGCLEFVYATTPDGEEVALSYWPDEAAILRWKQDLEHRVAQQDGYAKWYSEFRIQVGQIERDYGHKS